MPWPRVDRRRRTGLLAMPLTEDRTRSSDHNPFIKDHRGVGVVRAIDITHDPRDGCDANKLAERFRALGKAGDSRVSYVIWNRRIASSREGWRWRYYSGSNPHTKHVHLSVSTSHGAYDSTRSWGIANLVGGLSVADVDKIMAKLGNIDGDVATVRRQVGKVAETANEIRAELAKERGDRAAMERRFGAELDELRQQARRELASLGYPSYPGAHTVVEDGVDPATLPVIELLARVDQIEQLVRDATQPREDEAASA